METTVFTIICKFFSKVFCTYLCTVFTPNLHITNEKMRPKVIFFNSCYYR